MVTKKFTLIIVSIILAFAMFFCKPAEVILHGDIIGSVTDSSTKKPLQNASVILKQINDTVQTGNEGQYIFNGLKPGDYEIQASKYGYGTIKQNVTVVSAETKKIDFPLNGIPADSISVRYLDFGLDLTQRNFVISNIGQGKLIYVLSPSKPWIIPNRTSGEITDKPDTITVTVNKTGLSENAFKEAIIVYSLGGQDNTQDTIAVYLNGLLDQRKNEMKFYKVVKIGTQTWMAQNLNVGTKISSDISIQTNNKTIEKFCYEDDANNCLIYGGIYQWDEMMQYNPADSGLVGSTQGVCPDGWHIPTPNEWIRLVNYLGGTDVAGGKLKETGQTHWVSSIAATNETGFTALPGGLCSTLYWGLHSIGNWWSSAIYYGDHCYYWSLSAYNGSAIYDNTIKMTGFSVRCIKN